MISWRSFTTSKVLPTFVGESSITASTSFSYSNTLKLFDINQNQSFTQSSTQIRTEKLTRNATLTYGEGYRGFTFEDIVGNRIDDQPNDITSIIVTQNSTINQSRSITNISPPAVVRQETTVTEAWEREIQISTTISAYEGEDEDGNVLNDPIVENVWTTTSTVLTNATGGTRGVTNFDFTTTNTTETVQSFNVVPSTRTVTTTTGGDLTFTTYTHPDGDVLLVENTIWESVPNVGPGGYQWRSAVTANSPNSEIPITALAYAPSRFTVLYSEFTETLPVRADSASTIPVTTRQTQKTGHKTTRVGFAPDNYTGWFYSFETRPCKNNSDGANRFVPVSFPINGQSTFEEPTQVNTTTETFQTFNGRLTAISFQNYTTIIGADFNKPDQNRTSTFFVPNTVPKETTTFQLSGQLTTSKSITWPGLFDKKGFPWSSTGDGARRFYSLSNSATTLIKTTSEAISFAHSWNISYSTTFIADESGTITENWENKKIGQFYSKKIPGATTKSNAATAIIAQSLDGLASPALTFATQNTHTTVGVFMTANAQHTWEGGQNIFGNFTGIGFGNISQRVIGAIPLYPTFSGLIRRDAEGWELCDTSEFTTVRGSRVGSQFSTTIAWQTVEGTSTKNSTSSGEFTMGSTNSAEFGVRQEAQTIAGGFQTPNAARTVIVSPGALLTTTYDSAGSGSGETSFATGTSFTTAPVGPVPITLSSFIQRVQGYGVVTQQLLDNGLP
jgi:hypothetical protein